MLLNDAMDSVVSFNRIDWSRMKTLVNQPDYIVPREHVTRPTLSVNLPDNFNDIMRQYKRTARQLHECRMHDADNTVYVQQIALQRSGRQLLQTEYDAMMTAAIHDRVAKGDF